MGALFSVLPGVVGLYLAATARRERQPWRLAVGAGLVAWEAYGVAKVLAAPPADFVAHEDAPGLTTAGVR